MSKRITRAETAQQNRMSVLRAARLHFERFGFHGASLDAIAEDAGFSKGAVYSRFDSKDDVFLAVLADHVEERRQAIADRFAGPAKPDDLPRLVQAAISTNVATVAWQAALLEFRAHAWRHPEVNARYRAIHRRTIEVVAESIADLFRRSGRRPVTATEVLALSALAAGTGVVAEYMADDQLDVDQLSRIVARLFEPVDESSGKGSQP